MTYEEFIEEWRRDVPYIACGTSGSTGAPKIIRLPKAELENSARRTIEFFSLGVGAHFHSCISPDYIGGKMMAVRSEISGGRLTWEEPSNRPLTHYSGGTIDLMAVVPSQMLHLLDNRDSLPEIGHIIIGGAPVSESLARRIQASGLNAWETYGMTETASHVALRKVEGNPGPFMPLRGIETSSDNGRLVIAMDGWQTLVTNDIVELNEDGSFYVCGRADNVIITGGKKVHPEQVESLLERVLGARVLVCGEPDVKWGERVILTVECDENNAARDPQHVMALCRELLPNESVPKEIRYARIPRTPNGKKKRSHP